MSYAAATIAEPLAAVVAAHLSLCPRCRAEVADLERLGAAVLLSAPRALNAPLMQLPRRPADQRNCRGISATKRPQGRLPAPIAIVYGLSLDRIPWKRLGPGVWHHRLALRQESGGDLRLLRIARRPHDAGSRPRRRRADAGHRGRLQRRHRQPIGAATYRMSTRASSISRSSTQAPSASA